MVIVTRRLNFSAAHRLFNPTFSEEENSKVFDKCNNLNGHGHNYVLDVSVKGTPNPNTGYVIDLKKLKDIVERVVIDVVDHKHLNHDVVFLQGVIPTAENLVKLFWDELKPHILEGELCKLTLYESENNFVEFFGEEFNIPRY